MRTLPDQLHGEGTQRQRQFCHHRGPCRVPGEKQLEGKRGDRPLERRLNAIRLFAFLAYPNFRVFTEWNQSLNYATTAAYLATRIAGAPAMSRGNAPVTPLGFEQLKELQTLLDRAGYKQAEIDGKLGVATRAAVRQAQLKLGLPADSYPSLELLDRMRPSGAVGRPRPVSQ